jgi:hypothetical protein
MLETPRMRTLKLHFPNDALSPLDAFVQQTKEARGCHRAQAVRAVVKGQRLPTVSDTLQLTYSALRTWVYRFATQGTPGLVDRPRPGRPPQSDLCTRTIPPSAWRSRPCAAWRPLCAVAWSSARACPGPAARGPTRP